MPTKQRWRDVSKVKKKMLLEHYEFYNSTRDREVTVGEKKIKVINFRKNKMIYEKEK